MIGKPRVSAVMSINPALLALLLSVSGCGQRAPDPPPLLTLAGTWVCEIDKPGTNYFKSTTTVNSKGEYLCFISIERSNVSDFFQVEAPGK
jgi:hypothetical protein